VKRDASAKAALDTDAHLWPDSDELTRTAINAVTQARAEELRDCRRVTSERLPAAGRGAAGRWESA